MTPMTVLCILKWITFKNREILTHDARKLTNGTSGKWQVANHNDGSTFEDILIATSGCYRLIYHVNRGCWATTCWSFPNRLFLNIGHEVWRISSTNLSCCPTRRRSAKCTQCRKVRVAERVSEWVAFLLKNLKLANKQRNAHNGDSSAANWAGRRRKRRRRFKKNWFNSLSRAGLHPPLSLSKWLHATFRHMRTSVWDVIRSCTCLNAYENICGFGSCVCVPECHPVNKNPIFQGRGFGVEAKAI